MTKLVATLMLVLMATFGIARAAPVTTATFQSTSFNSRVVPTETTTCRRGFLLAGGRDVPCNSTPV